jgi:hypothetical protein
VSRKNLRTNHKMQAEVALNVQQSIRPGECVDTYYAGKENSLKQCAPTVEDNRFFVNVPSLNSGSSSTITFNPNEGLAEVILTLQLPQPSTVTVDGDPVVGQGLALPLGWGYHFIKRIGYRYGSSQLYYISGAQNLMQALALCEDSGKKQQLMNLGGQALLSSADWADAGARTGYVYLRLPHSSPALSGGALPFPSDILTAPVQIQIDFENFDKVYSSATVAGQAPSTYGSAFQSAVVNFTQVTFQDAGDLVARRFDMAKNALTIPLPEGWTQEEVRFPITAPSDGTFQISLTGCKAGDLKKLRVFFTKDSDLGTGGVYEPNLWYAPSQITFAINGLIYLDSRNGSYQLNNLLRRRTPPTVTYSALALPTVAGDPYTAVDQASTWVEIDLGQPFTIGNSQEVALVHGVPVMNSVMNLTGVLPAAGAWTAHCEYVLNCSWMASRGSAEFIF